LIKEIIEKNYKPAQKQTPFRLYWRWNRNKFVYNPIIYLTIWSQRIVYILSIISGLILFEKLSQFLSKHLPSIKFSLRLPTIQMIKQREREKDFIIPQKGITIRLKKYKMTIWTMFPTLIRYLVHNIAAFVVTLASLLTLSLATGLFAFVKSAIDYKSERPKLEREIKDMEEQIERKYNSLFQERA